MTFLKMSDATKIFFDDSGDGEAILFAHGLNSSHAVNESFYSEFRDDFRVILYDHRSHGLSDTPHRHMNVKRLGMDMNEIIEALELDNLTVFGHSMGAATIYSYIDQFGCDKLKAVIASDMSPYMRNDGWGGGIAQGKWSDEDFFKDFERIFDDVGSAAWHISKSIMNPGLSNLCEDEQNEMIRIYRQNTDAFTMASLWYSLFRCDQRPAMANITVPLLYIMPDNPLYSMEAVEYIKNNVKSSFFLDDDFPGSTHSILRQNPHEVAESVKKFLKKINRVPK